MRKLVQAFAIVGIFSVLGFACMGAAHAATAPPDPETDAGGFLRLLYDAATSKQWSIVAGYVLVGLAFVVRKYALGRFHWTQTRWGGFGIAVALSLAGTLGLALGTGAPIDLSTVVAALSTAMTAAGGWTWLQNALEKKPATIASGEIKAGGN